MIDKVVFLIGFILAVVQAAFFVLCFIGLVYLIFLLIGSII